MKALPKELIESLKILPGFKEQDFIESHREENKITSIRLNPFKKTELDLDLNDPVKWCAEGFYLSERPSFTHDPLFHAGCYYVQEAGSMFLEFALKSTLDLSQPLKILDSCASPGGKSTLINSLISAESLLVANEIIKSRADILSYNLSKWGTCNTIVTNNDPSKFASITGYFDAVVVDAPCSGSGLFRKQPEAIDEWSVANVQLCCGRQQKILEDILPSLKENGILIYSTCSYSIEEDENIVDFLVKNCEMEYIPLAVPKEWGIVETQAGYRFYPHLTQSEGFFCAALRKKSSTGTVKQEKLKETPLNKQEREILQPFIKTENKFFFRNNGLIHFMNEAAMRFVAQFGKVLYFKKAGVISGEIKGKDMVPHHELALSIDFTGENKLNVDIENALKFLKKQNFESHVSGVGFWLISYKNQGLGWAKILPNRINNYLPNELRILN